MKSYLLKELSRTGSAMYIIMFPGVVLHEFSHMLACKIVGVKVTSVKFFSNTGGFVEYVGKKNSYIKNFIISIAPMIVGLAINFLIIRSIGDNQLTVIEVIRTIILTYLAISIFFGLFPSYKDFQNAWIGYISLVALLGIFRLKLFENAQMNSNIFLISVATIAILAIMIAILKVYRTYRWR